LGEQARAELDNLGRQARLTWITGNHDPHPPAWLGGEVVESLRLGGLIFRHEPRAEFEPGEVAGHLHPCARAAKWGRSVRRRCFVSDGLRLILPSFGAFTGGLDVGDEAFAVLFAGPFHAYMLGNDRVYAMVRGVAV
jgi:metallophosphoesterase superfamily enzyme